MRLEISGPKDHSKYYLVKDIRVGTHTARLKKYLGTNAPTPAELRVYEKKFALGIELKAANMAGKLGAKSYRTQYLAKDRVSELEEVRYMAKLVSDNLTKSELEAYEQQFEVRYVHGTTTIEGNTLTLSEASDLLVYDILPAKRSLREVNEIQNFKAVKAYRGHYRGKVNVTLIKHLHALIMRNIDVESAGIFRRTDDIGILGVDMRLCPSILIEDELERIINDYYGHLKDGYHPFEAAVLFHYHFESIHPFADGNGRVGREILNYMLTRKGYPGLLITLDERSAYMEALRLGNENKFEELAAVFARICTSQKKDILRDNVQRLLSGD